MLKTPQIADRSSCAAPHVAALGRHYKWEMLALLCLAYFFHQGDRAIYGIVVSSIQSELNLTSQQVGIVGSALFLTLALVTPVAGYLGDLFNRKWIITGSLIFWSVATSLTGLVTGLPGLIAFRSVATAGGESFYAPAACSLMAAMHRETRALALSIHQGALYVGVMVSGFLGGWIAEQWGWRSAFYLFGAGGIVLGLVFIWRLKEAPRERDGRGREGDTSPMKEAPRGEPAEVGDRVSPREAYGALFRTPTALLATVGFTAIVFVNNAYMIWAPNFLEEKFQLTLTEAGGRSMFYHHIAALFGVLVGGRLSDLMVLSRPQFRLQLQAASILLAAPMLVAMGLADSLAATCAAMAGMGLFRGLCESNTQATLFDVIPPRYRASAVSVMVMIAFVIGSTSSWLLGCCRDQFGRIDGLSYGFAGFSLVYVAGGLAFLAALLWTFRRDRYVEGDATAQNTVTK